jgi:glyceraldehyde 3-phosphate dehydrogenase/glyceraldehyde-3-phosphate dehydrogenase (NAD(P))
VQVRVFPPRDGGFAEPAAGGYRGGGKIMIRFAINGLGRIGRLVLREYARRGDPGLQLVAVNDLTDTDTLAYLLKYDSVHGRMAGAVAASAGHLHIGGQAIAVLAQPDPAQLPWRDLDIDWVVECTGRVRRREQAALHQDAGARKVLISAPAESADITVILGVNAAAYDAGRHHIVSSGSCTTNSLAPPLAVLLDRFGIETATATTIHSYTSSQALVDVAARKRTRGRAAALNLVPTTTGADKVVTAVLPALEGRFLALAVRVPIPDGALTDICANLSRDVTAAEVNAAMAQAARDQPAIFGFTEEEWVSSDIIGDSRSAIVHGLSTRVLAQRVVKLQVWYDNEHAYACRLLDTLQQLSASG